MIADLKPYSDYKESGDNALDSLPAHWEVRRLKTVLREKDGRSIDGSGLLLSLTRNRGLIARSDMTDKIHSARTLAGYKCYEPGEIVMNRMQAWSGMFGAGHRAGLVSPDYAVFKLLGEDHVGFILARLKSPDMVSQFALASRGIGTGFNRLYSDKFGAITVSLPPPAEQSAIVRFLDHWNGRLERAVRSKRRVIALLQEQKQAIIHRAVTRGLDPNVKLKDSGIPWLGEIPAHWEVRRFKFLTRINSGQVDPREKQHRSKILIAPNHIEGGTGRIIDQVTADSQGADSGKYLVSRGQIIYSKIRPNLRKAAIAPCDCLCSADMYGMSVNEAAMRTEYLLLLLLSVPFTKFAVDTSMRVAMPKVNREALADCPLWFPSLEEQDQIILKVKKARIPFEQAINRYEREITLLREYRTRLTADVVTGKLDVRAAAAQLPDPEPEEAVVQESAIEEEPLEESPDEF